MLSMYKMQDTEGTLSTETSDEYLTLNTPN